MATTKKETPFQELWDNTEAPNIDISALRSYLIKKVPFYSQALQRVDISLIDDPKSPSWGWTNGFRVYINPRLYIVHGKQVIEANRTWFATPILGIAFTILHEIGHIVFDSFGRLGHRDPKMWNIATDYQINQFIAKLMEQSGMFQTKESFTAFLKVINENLCFDPAKFEKLTSEGTYDDLYRVSISKSGQCPGDDKSLGGDMQYEDDDKLSDEEKMDRDIVKSELSNYAEKNASKLPGTGSGFREFQFMLEPPKINLRMVLKQIEKNSFTDDWGYTSRQSRMDHMLPGNIRLPVLTATNPDMIKKIFFVLDSSGSMTNEQLNEAINIVKELLEKYTRTPVWLIIHTSEVVYSGNVKEYNDVAQGFSGGTSFVPVIEEIKRLKKEEHIEGNCYIWLTDYYGEIDFQPHDLPFNQKKMRWIISGSKAEPSTGKTYYLDEIG